MYRLEIEIPYACRGGESSLGPNCNLTLPDSECKLAPVKKSFQRDTACLPASANLLAPWKYEYKQDTTPQPFPRVKTRGPIEAEPVTVDARGKLEVSTREDAWPH